jgi:probable rRNA maturation factor
VTSLHFSHHARSTPYQVDRLEKLVTAALPHCLQIARKHHAELSSLPGIEITVLGARAMARVHRGFLGIPGPTDVITFPYGEILVCAPVAAARASDFSHGTTEEIAIYIIHGLLHLSGFDDIANSDSKKMAAAQQEILQTILLETLKSRSLPSTS